MIAGVLVQAHNGKMDALSPKPFKEAALRAFPAVASAIAKDAERELSPFVDDSYRRRFIAVHLRNQRIYIPSRLAFDGLPISGVGGDSFGLASLCLLSRATDGYLRQRALRSIISHKEEWIVPFVVFLLGEYVIEIVEEIRGSLRELDRPTYANFVRENRHLMQALRVKAISYWDVYHRRDYTEKRNYPGLEALHQLERWAAEEMSD